MSPEQGFFESDEDYKNRVAMEANEKSIEDHTGIAPTKGFFERDEDYRDRISKEANESRVEAYSGTAPKKGFFENEEDYVLRIDREANESKVKAYSETAPTKGLFESDENYGIRVRKEANERIIERHTGISPIKGWFESDHDYRSRIAHEAREIEADGMGDVLARKKEPSYSGNSGSRSYGSSYSSSQASYCRSNNISLALLCALWGAFIGVAVSFVICLIIYIPLILPISIIFGHSWAEYIGNIVFPIILFSGIIFGACVKYDSVRQNGVAKYIAIAMSLLFCFTLWHSNLQSNYNIIFARISSKFSAAPQQRQVSRAVSFIKPNNSIEKTNLYPTIKKYDSKTVYEIQRLLTTAGYSTGPCDGQYGNKTAKAIASFQTHEGIKPDGMISVKLLEYLRRYDRIASASLPKKKNVTGELNIEHDNPTNISESPSFNSVNKDSKDDLISLENDTHAAELSPNSMPPQDAPVNNLALENSARPSIVTISGRFKKYDNGIITDSNTDLEWYVGPAKVNLNEAKEWVLGLATAGGGWRLPTLRELKEIYQKGAGIMKGFSSHNRDAVFEPCGAFIWSSEEKKSYDYSFQINGRPQEIYLNGFNFDSGKESHCSDNKKKSILYSNGVFAVRELRHRDSYLRNN